MENICKNLIEEVWDENKFNEKINIVIEIIDEVSGKNFQRDNIRTEVFTKNVLISIDNNRMR
jgi:hypothetical protein